MLLHPGTSQEERAFPSTFPRDPSPPVLTLQHNPPSSRLDFFSLQNLTGRITNLLHLPRAFLLTTVLSQTLFPSEKDPTALLVHIKPLFTEGLINHPRQFSTRQLLCEADVRGCPDSFTDSPAMQLRKAHAATSAEQRGAAPLQTSQVERETQRFWVPNPSKAENFSSTSVRVLPPCSPLASLSLWGMSPIPNRHDPWGSGRTWAVA